MPKKIFVIAGLILSGLFGYAVFQVTGLCEACSSGSLKYALGAGFIVIFMSVFRSAFVNGRCKVAI